MGYRLKPGEIYHMPVHFGPMTAARKGTPYENKKTLIDNVTSVVVTFITNREQLEPLLPEKGFKLRGEPSVTISCNYMGSVGWLAGRPYNIVHVSTPVTFDGEVDHAVGNLSLVVWESMCEPILAGREDLGWSKIWAEIPDPRYFEGALHATASWMGFKFLDIHVKNIKELTEEERSAMLKEAQPIDGSLHYKYIAKTGVPNEADASYVTLSGSKGGIAGKLYSISKAEGTIQFHRASWEEMPTQCHIVNTLAALEIKGYRDVLISKGGGGAMGQTRILR